MRTPEQVAEDTCAAYSWDRYKPSGWRACAKWLMESAKLTDDEAEAVLRSKIMRWAGDRDNKRRYGHLTGKTLQEYYDNDPTAVRADCVKMGLWYGGEK